MMSPDPPRVHDVRESPEGLPQFHFNGDEDIVGEGEHVLDYSSQPESWTSEDDGDNYPGTDPRGIDVEDEMDEMGNMRVRTQYRMLIPFQIENTQDSEEDEDEGHTGIPMSHSSDTLNTPTDSNTSSQPSVPASAQITKNVTELTPAKREIILNDDSVQTIKTAMQSIKLPDSAIPSWAKEVNEDTWRTKLMDSLSSKNSSD